jgi:hypothetical protein
LKSSVAKVALPWFDLFLGKGLEMADLAFLPRVLIARTGYGTTIYFDRLAAWLLRVASLSGGARRNSCGTTMATSSPFGGCCEDSWGGWRGIDA